MRFATKVCLAIYSMGIVSSSLTCIAVYDIFSSRFRREFVRHYEDLGHNVAGTFYALEKEMNRSGLNAARVFFEVDKQRGRLSQSEMLELAGSLGVQDLYAYDPRGKTISWTMAPADPHFNAFDVCYEYTGFFSGRMTTDISPFVPVASAPSTKFVKMANHDRTRMLNVALYSRYVDELMEGVLANNPDMLSVDIFTPSGISLRAPNDAQSTRIPIGSSDAVATFELVVPSVVKECCQCVQKGLMTDADEYFYRLRLSVTTQKMRDAIAQVKFALCGFFAVTAVIALVVARRLAKRLVTRMEVINATANEVIDSGDLAIRVPAGAGTDEVEQLARSFNTMMNSLRISQEKLVESERMVTIARLATQVAHDIRSPLAAVKMVGRDLAALPEETRNLLRSSIYRIEDIANQLLIHRRSPKREELGRVQISLLSGLIETLVSEKRTQYRAHLNILIASTLGPESYGLFAAVGGSDFKRILSNLITNAVEAIEGTGKILIGMERSDEELIISIEDDGVGIPDDILLRLGAGELTHNKTDGNGIGIYFARKTLAEWNGCLKFKSTVGVGTIAEIRLPCADPPSWFLTEICLDEIDTVVILDDDLSIHQIWSERLGRKNVALVHVSTPADFDAWISSESQGRKCLYLVDYELLEHRENGLDVVQKHSISSTSVLVTSRFEEDSVLDRCCNLGIRLIPKPVAAYVPIRWPSVTHEPRPKGWAQFILIDDDPVIRRAWHRLARDRGANILTYPDVTAFLEAASHQSKAAVIYVDSNLAQGVKGEDAAQEIFDLGFKNIHLATGRQDVAGPLPAWIRSVVRKEAPF